MHPAKVLACSTLAAIAVVLASGCSWQSAYLSAQNWQRSQCYKMPDETQRERCLAGATTSYDDYRRQRDGAGKQ